MIRLNLLSKAYIDQKLFEEATITINKGEKCALVGKNGAGKTTLLRMIAGQEEPDEGTITYPRGYRIGYLQQHLDITTSNLVDEAALGLREDRSDLRYLVETMLIGLGFTEEDFSRHPSEFSGGYLIRIHLCKLLLSEPDCLLLDEPSNYLDIVALRWLVDFLQSWKGEMLIISHDRELLDTVSTHTLGIHRHRLKKVEGGTEEYYTQILQEEEVYERTRIKTEKKRSHMQSFVDRFGAKASKAAQAQSRAKAILKMPVLEKLAHLQNLDFQFRYSPYQSQMALNASAVSFSYDGSEDWLIDNIDLAIERGEKIAIVGKNGRGKSTLLRLLIKDLSAQKGEIKMPEPVRVGYFGQTHIDRLDSEKTIYEEVAQANPALDFTTVKGICGIMMFSGDLSEKRIGVLSGGERSRVLLAKILATPCNLLVLDEPANHLDMESVEALVSAIEQFPGTVILVTHSEWILRRIPNKLVICRQNRQMVFDGNYEDFLTKVGWEEQSNSKPKTEKSSSNPKILRQDKAKDSLGKAPLKNKVKAIEARISELETTLSLKTEKTIEAAQKGNGLLIAELSKEINQIKEQLDALYSEYETL
jgi:ATP-binding cassette subfamily F protein 3